MLRKSLIACVFLASLAMEANAEAACDLQRLEGEWASFYNPSDRRLGEEWSQFDKDGYLPGARLKFFLVNDRLKAQRGKPVTNLRGDAQAAEYERLMALASCDASGKIQLSFAYKTNRWHRYKLYFDDAQEGDALVGRFTSELRADEAQTTVFKEGRFRLDPVGHD